MHRGRVYKGPPLGSPFCFLNIRSVLFLINRHEQHHVLAVEVAEGADAFRVVQRLLHLLRHAFVVQVAGQALIVRHIVACDTFERRLQDGAVTDGLQSSLVVEGQGLHAQLRLQVA